MKWFERFLVAAGLSYVLLYGMVAQQARAHTLKPGECTAIASDVARFMKFRSLGYSLDEANESFRQMLLDQGWFTYVRDKEDVERMRSALGKIWELPEDASANEVRFSTLNDCDPDNEEQYEFSSRWTHPHGI